MQNTAPQIEESIHSIRFVASALDDIEGVKLAQSNRLRIMTSTEPDSDGVVRGFGYGDNNPNVVTARMTIDALTAIEADQVKELQRQMKANPLSTWSKAQRGVGEKQLARLLSCIGDPYWRGEDIINPTDQPQTLRDGTIITPGAVKYPRGPRTLRQLWAYCGVHTASDGTAARLKRGEKANWNNEAKTRAWLIIQSCMKQVDPECRLANKEAGGIWEHLEKCKCSRYRIIVDKRRLHTEKTHPDWTPGHSLADAMRIASRELLRDLYNESKRIHVEGAEQSYDVEVAA